jgi:hypothetical protein
VWHGFSFLHFAGQVLPALLVEGNHREGDLSLVRFELLLHFQAELVLIVKVVFTIKEIHLAHNHIEAEVLLLVGVKAVAKNRVDFFLLKRHCLLEGKVCWSRDLVGK